MPQRRHWSEAELFGSLMIGASRFRDLCSTIRSSDGYHRRSAPSLRWRDVSDDPDGIALPAVPGLVPHYHSILGHTDQCGRPRLTHQGASNWDEPSVRISFIDSTECRQ